MLHQPFTYSCFLSLVPGRMVVKVYHLLTLDCTTASFVQCYESKNEQQQKILKVIHRCSFGKSQVLSEEVTVFVPLLSRRQPHLPRLRFCCWSTSCCTSGSFTVAAANPAVPPVNQPALSAPQLKAHSKEEDGSRGCLPLDVGGKRVAALWHGDAAAFVWLVW